MFEEIKRLKLTRNTFALETSVRLYVQAAPNDSNPAGCYPGKRRSSDSTVKPPTKRPFARNVPLLPIPKSSKTPVPTLRRAKVFRLRCYYLGVECGSNVDEDSVPRKGVVSRQSG
ncbi:hypothetical protein HZH66_012100 [Vespula vulgaris]|uniref:Uncharacterized protein n=2 Tax=Vespula TaxID=7451 RepID=A0A834JAV7_VESVU|nr:hypothetical protein HZH66_012100 [Vespula vulgaris]